MTEMLIEERRLSAVILSFNRPRKLNALSGALLDRLAERLRALDADRRVRGIVITGRGRAFSTGADLGRALEARTPAATARLLDHFREANRVIEDLGKPVVAAINGYCLTGGLEIALACDVRIAASDATFGITSARIGSVAGAGATQRLPRVVGPEQAKHLLFSAERIDAATALRIGLVGEVVPLERLLDAALARVTLYARSAPLSVRDAKRAVNAALRLPLEEGLDHERALVTDLWTTEDRIEGMRAFLEKREPRFRGR